MGFPFPFERLRLNPQPMPNNHSENRRILIIDDERPILLTLEALLSRHGYEPDTAATASYGLRCACLRLTSAWINLARREPQSQIGTFSDAVTM